MEHPLTIEVPQTGDVLTDCGRRLLVFCATDPSYLGYDVPGVGGPPDVILPEQLDATNAAMRAFAFKTDWQRQELIGVRLPQLHPRLIPLEADLIELGDEEWAGLRPRVVAAYQRIIEPHRGAKHRIRAVAASKILHLKRPSLFAIVDFRVTGYLRAGQTDPVATAMAVTDAIRALGRHGGNRQALARCAEYLRDRRLEGRPVVMTQVRMLDALIWMKATPMYRRLFQALDWGPL